MAGYILHVYHTRQADFYSRGRGGEGGRRGECLKFNGQHGL